MHVLNHGGITSYAYFIVLPVGVISAYSVHVQSVNEVERQVGLRQDNHNTSSYKAKCSLERWYKYTDKASKGIASYSGQL